MHTTLKPLPINWKNGMNIQATHFNALERSIEERLRSIRTAFLTSYNYGLIAPVSLSKVSQEGNTLSLRLLSCEAITKGGHQIELTEDFAKLLPQNYTTATYDVSDKSLQQLDVLLHVNPFQRIPVGELLAELPTRHPYTLPTYQLSLVPTEEVNPEQLSNNHLIIAQIARNTTGKFDIKQDYIPPCTKINCTIQLQSLHQTGEDILKQLLVYITDIIQKIDDNQRQIEWVKNIELLMNDIRRFLASSLANYRLLLEQAPVHLFSYFKQLAQLIQSALDAASAKEDMLNYMNRYLDGANNFEQILHNFLASKYRHIHIKNHITQLNYFRNNLVDLFSRIHQKPYLIDRFYVPVNNKYTH